MNGTSWPLAWRLARREIAAGMIGSGFRGFRIFILGLAIGVAAIAGIGTLSASVTAGLRAEGANLLGGDIDIRLHNRPASPGQDAWFAAHPRTEIYGQVEPGSPKP